MRALYSFLIEIQRGKEDHEPPRVSVVLPAAGPDRMMGSFA